MAHETFGPYLLLKKLSEDALGEVFRAGRLRDGNLEQVVLLRTFNGRAINAAATVQGIQQRQQVQTLLRSPNLAQGLDAGEFQGIPYIVYDYISGRDLGSLMRQASLRSHPVPTEHALLVAERLALGLSVAHGTKLGNDRIVHGFLVPELVMLSNEGENRLLGFEAGPALRASEPTSELWSTFGRYLSPETHAGSPLAPTDDVYSMGVILLELLVGHTLENLGPSSLQGAIAQVKERGLPNVAELIEKSVAPLDRRFENAATWHQNLSRLALDRQSRSTPFHLAFYMHNLFRDEIERESEEIEHEKSIDFSKQQIGPVPNLETKAYPTLEPSSQNLAESNEPELAAALAAPPTATASTGAGQASPPAGKDTSATATPSSASSTASSAAKEPSKGKGLLLAVAALILLSVGGFFGWKQFGEKIGAKIGAKKGTVQTAASSTLAAEKTTPGGSSSLASSNGDTDGSQTPAGASGQDGGSLAVTDARALAEGVASDTIDPSAARRDGEREELMAELDRLVDERTKTAAQGLKDEYDGEVQRLKDQLDSVEREKAAQIERDAEEARKKALADEKRKQDEAEAAKAAEAERKRLASEAEAAKKALDAKKEAATKEPAPRKIRVGELVQPGPGIRRPRLAGKLNPAYPFAAKRLRREADVEVEVLVDENGKVVDSRMGVKAGFGFDEAAVSAAKGAKFTPASTQGVNVKMWTTIRVRFRLDK